MSHIYSKCRLSCRPDVLHAVVLRCTCYPLKSSDRCNINNGLVCNYHATHLTPKVVLSGWVYTLSLVFCLLCSTSFFGPINVVILKRPLWRCFSGLTPFLSLIGDISMEKYEYLSKRTHHPFSRSAQPLQNKEYPFIGSTYKLI